MYNNEALSLSSQNITKQVEFLKNTRPYLKQITIVNSEENMKCDYLFGIDAYSIDSSGKNFTIQFKTRKAGNKDLILPATKLSGEAALKNDSIGFWYFGTKYTFLTTADIYVETVDEGTFSFTRQDVDSIEFWYKHNLEKILTGIQRKKIYDDKGNQHCTNDYFAFIKPCDLMEMLARCYNAYNPSYWKK